MAWLNPESKNHCGYSWADNEVIGPYEHRSGPALLSNQKSSSERNWNLNSGQMLAAILPLMYAPNFVSADFMR
jgi:hypothetical protein